MYSEKDARELVIRAGKELVKKELIARTWGNISARISETQFIITPSGRAYEDLQEEDLVKVNIADCSYEGDVKPSSEKGIHADIYALRADAAFIIHTHQHYASAICVEGEDTDFAPCAGYGLPGTKKLRREVAEAVRKNLQSDAFLMERHGAVVCGKTYEKAFESVNILEERCKELYESRKKTVSQKAAEQPYLDDYAQILGFGRSPVPDEDAEAIALIRTKNSAAASYAQKARRMKCLDVLLQHAVYKMKYSKLKNKQ